MPAITNHAVSLLAPPIGLALAGIDFSTLKFVLQQAVGAVGTEGAAGFVAAKPEVAINRGKFIIVAWVLFMIIRAMNAMKKQRDAALRSPGSQLSLRSAGMTDVIFPLTLDAWPKPKSAASKTPSR